MGDIHCVLENVFVDEDKEASLTDAPGPHLA
jgi:hypothetical protein